MASQARLGTALGAGFGAVRRSKRLLLLTAVSTMLIALPPAVWFGHEVHMLAARRPDAHDLARTLDPDFFAELRASNPSFDGTMTTLVVTSLVLYLLLRPLVWGGFCGIAATDRRLPFATFLREGGANYWKFLRILVIGCVLLFAMTLAVQPLLNLVEDWAKNDPDESVGGRYRIAGHIAALAGLWIVTIVLGYVKVGVRLHRRPGVLAEVWRSATFVLHHPFRTTGLFLFSRLIDVLAMAALCQLISMADGAYITSSVIVVILGTLLVAALEAATLFHLATAWHFRAAEDAPPPPQPATEEDGEPDILQAPLPWHAS